MILKCIVLLRVEYFEQGGRRIAAKVVTDLVDLVDHEQRIVRPDLANLLNDSARQRADVSPTVAAYVRFVPYPADGHANELAAQRPCDRSAQRRLAHSRRTGKAENRPTPGRVELAHREVLKDALLDLVQIVVVLVQNLLGLADVELVLRGLGPRKFAEPAKIIHRAAVFRRRLVRPREPFKFPVGLLLDSLRHLGLGDGLAQLIELDLAAVCLAELLLDGPHLLLEVVLPLSLVDLAFDLLLNLR